MPCFKGTLQASASSDSYSSAVAFKGRASCFKKIRLLTNAFTLIFVSQISFFNFFCVFFHIQFVASSTYLFLDWFPINYQSQLQTFPSNMIKRQFL